MRTRVNRLCWRGSCCPPLQFLYCVFVLLVFVLCGMPNGVLLSQYRSFLMVPKIFSSVYLQLRNINVFLFFIAKHVYGSVGVKRWARESIIKTTRPYVFICVSYFLISFLLTIFPVVVTKQMYVFYVGVSLDIENTVFYHFGTRMFPCNLWPTVENDVKY